MLNQTGVFLLVALNSSSSLTLTHGRWLLIGFTATDFGKGPDSPRGMGVAMTLLKPFLRKPSRGAATSVLLATADEDVPHAGLYWSDEAPKEPAPAALDPDTAARLWTESEHLVGTA